VDAASTRLQALSEEIANAIPQPVHRDDQHLQDICGGCIEVSKTLSVVLKDVKVSMGNNNSKKWQSYRKGLKSVWKKGEIDEIVTRLDRFRTELNSHVLVALRYVTVYCYNF